MKNTNKFFKDLLRYGKLIDDYNFTKDYKSIRVKKTLYDNHYYIIIMENGIVTSISQEIFAEEV